MVNTNKTAYLNKDGFVFIKMIKRQIKRRHLSQIVIIFCKEIS